MLGGQALNRWNFRLAEFRQLAGNATAGERELLIVETALGLRQAASLARRMDSFSRSRVLAIRFQAQEMLIAATRLEQQLLEVQQQLQPSARSAEEVAITLLDRVRRGAHRRSGPDKGVQDDVAANVS
jgi:hypothetical protein